MIEEEASKRIEMLVKKRVEEELERRRDEIESEVSRRVQEKKAEMEQELILELEKRREAAREEERKREVGYRPAKGVVPVSIFHFPWLYYYCYCAPPDHYRNKLSGRFRIQSKSIVVVHGGVIFRYLPFRTNDRMLLIRARLLMGWSRMWSMLIRM